MRFDKNMTQQYASGWNDAIETVAFMLYCAIQADPPVLMGDLIQRVREMKGAVDDKVKP